MGGTITDQQPPASYDFPASRPVVFRYTPGKPYEALPNIECTAVARTEGPNAGHAQFRYVFDSLNTTYPQRIEDVQPTAKSGPGIVRPDDRLVVAMIMPNGDPYLLFDGFASIPEAGYSLESEVVTFQAVATPCRCFDTPITTTRWRQASTPTTTSANISTGLRCLFNPDGKGNISPSGSDAHVKQPDGSYRDYPVFLDPLAANRRWWASSAVAYLLGEYNDQSYVANPSLVELVSLLDCWEPTNGNTPINPADPSTYTSQAVDVNDEDATNKPWPEAIFDLINRHGFMMSFVLESDQNGFPKWRLWLYKSNEVRKTNQLAMTLQKAGNVLDVTASNTGGVKLAYDFNRIVNSWVCRSKPAEYEVSVMLAPLFSVSSSDTSNLEQFKTSSSTFDSVRNSYRLYGLDELGLGHWDFGLSSLKYTPADLTKVFGGSSQSSSQWVQRARVAKRTLFSKDSAGQVRHAVLDWIYASQYTGPVPGVWDQSNAANFNRVKGGWRLADDRCAIYVDVEDPSRFAWGDHSGAARGGLLSLVEAMNDATKRIYFRLTVVLESDLTADATAAKRAASPTGFTITRAIDGASRFRPQIISRFSQFGVTSADTLSRNDLTDQVHQAEARRFATEVPPFAGPLEIPWWTGAYQIGDRISGVNGRNWSLTADVGTAQGEAPVLPRVVGIEWVWGDKEQTTLHLSDLRVARGMGHA